MRSLIVTVGFLACIMWLVVPAFGDADSPDATVSQWDEQTYGPLPRWREGERPALDPNRSLHPYAITRRTPMRVPTSGVIDSPPEYAPTEGVIFRYSSYAWPQVVTDCVSALTKDANFDEIAYVVVSSTSQQNSATSAFNAAGADLSKVEFIIKPTDSIWLRDYGPHFIFQNDTRAIVDSHYYPTRPLDNFIPTILADDYFQVPSYDIGLYYSGGNFQPGPNRSGFMTSLVNLDNPSSQGFDAEFIAQLLQTYQGIDVFHVMPQLPFSVDGTGHIDMWFYIVDEDTVIISEFLPGSNPTAIQITNNAVPYMESLGFEVFRPPAHNAGGVHYTYTNAFRVNNRIFIPSYRTGGAAYSQRDAQAIAAWEAAVADEDAPVDIIPIDSWDIIPAAGAIHCIVMQVPDYTEPLPAAHVVSPDGGEVLVSGTTHDLQFCADDDAAVSTVDLYYSTDNGNTFPHVIAENEEPDGHFAWTVPDTLSQEAVVKVVASDADANTAEAISETNFIISDADQTVYDFSMDAGVDRWAWGYQAVSWTLINENRYPVTAELSATNYARMATSNATGGDSDSNRYISSYPSSGYESTHVFEFTIYEDPAEIIDLRLLWEGYADDCTQIEMYVWDHVSGNWGDGLGQLAQNRFMDNFAGNRDTVLEGHINGEVGRFIDAEGLLTILLYAERYGDRTFHDYMSVTVTHQLQAPGDLNGDGVVNAMDLGLMLGAWGACPGCAADLNGDGNVDSADLALLLGLWG